MREKPKRAVSEWEGLLLAELLLALQNECFSLRCNKNPIRRP